MTDSARRSTIYFDPQLHDALRVKAAHTRRTVSEIVNEAVRSSLAEDQEDLAAFKDRVAEPTMSYEALLDDLRTHGKI
ncbi:glucose-6-phosphate isomerase [Spiribacter curvatus]|uniref:Glucose-6-phosphate isomerase n=1 Tax=Spiribacter curvatus TaxID=1335757 RepID=U5T6X6_9GAMM|nr:glucose-6-phosphate isomerase [Spiribacter curvatus]AGY92088.1 glucose-6-phosphate isomerase [Spiribacter curvatus]